MCRKVAFGVFWGRQSLAARPLPTDLPPGRRVALRTPEDSSNCPDSPEGLWCHDQTHARGNACSNTQESTSKTALYLAAEKGQAAAIGCLLRHGADPHAPALISTRQMASRLSPLWAARRGGHANVEAMLVAAGATELAEAVPAEEPRD